MIIDQDFKIFWFNYNMFDINIKNHVIIKDISLFCKQNLKEFEKFELKDIINLYVMGVLHDGVYGKI